MTSLGPHGYSSLWSFVQRVWIGPVGPTKKCSAIMMGSSQQDAFMFSMAVYWTWSVWHREQ
jgi:hypothetical protein